MTPERFTRVAALALAAILLIAFVLLVSLFGSMQGGGAVRTPTRVALVTAPPTAPPTNTIPLPSATRTPTPIPSGSPTPSCPNPATPEPLWVDPVLSPTNFLSQRISVTLGRGREIEITDEAGTVKLPGQFSVARPAMLEVPLAPNTTNHLAVSGTVEYAPGCFYTLQTRTDRQGNPLVIVQALDLTPNPGTTLTPVPTVGTLAPGMIFLKPFSQVFALGQDTPDANQQIWLYQANANAPFRILAQQGAFTHLGGLDGTLNFWTLNDNLITSPAPAPRYDDSVRGTTAQFVPDTNIFACEGGIPQPLLLGICRQFQNLPDAPVVQRATIETSVLYLVQIENKMYWVSSNALKSEPQ